MSDYLENAEVKMMSAIENLESNLRTIRTGRAYHVVVYQDKCAIATGRMYFEDEKTMILGRIAVIKEYRGTGLGNKVVKSLENKAKELNCTTVKLSAQQRAQMFYEKLGYQPIGEVYYDEWCPHITMSKNI